MKKRSNAFYTLWSWAIVLCLVLVFFTFIFVSCSNPSDDGTGTTPPVSASPDIGTDPTPDPNGTDEPTDAGNPDETPGTSPSENPDAQNTPEPGEPNEPDTPVSSGNSSVALGQTEDMGQEYVDKFIFLGDSTTYGLGYYGVVATNQIWTPESGTLTLNLWGTTAISYPDTGSLVHIPDAAEAKKPEYMLITLGVNGVSFMDEEYFTSEYTNLVNAIKEKSPDTKIILNSIYPVAMSYKYIGDINNDKITAANSWIQNIAAATGVKYLDSYSVLVGENGFLPEDAHNGDGMHLTKESFDKVIANLRTHGYQ